MFKKWWDSLHKPLPGNKKGYKKGASDGWDACEKAVSGDLKKSKEILEDIVDWVGKNQDKSSVDVIKKFEKRIMKIL